MVRGHAALVSPAKPHFRPVDPVPEIGARQRLVQRPRRFSAAQRPTGVLVFFHRFRGGFNDDLRRLFHKGGLVLCDKNQRAVTFFMRSRRRCNPSSASSKWMRMARRCLFASALKSPNAWASFKTL